MPPDRSRAANPQGRQKSCAECAKAKRKCGLEQPSCARCSKQHLACVYPPQPGSQAATLRPDAPDSQDGMDIPQTEMDFGDVRTPNLPFDFEVPSADILDFDFSTGVSSLDSLTCMLNTSPNMQDQLAIQKTHYRVAKSFQPAQLSSFAKPRVEYTFGQLKLVPNMMVEYNGTPWAHMMLYEDYIPRSLQDAHAACALYITKNDTNAGLVARHITNRVEDLINSVLPNETVDVLGRAHALMLYQTMLIFGGDIESYGQVAALLPELEDVTSSLLPIAAEQTDNTDSLPLYPSTAARSAWKSYIFRESVRRTVISLVHLTTLCYLLLGQLKSCDNTLTLGNRVTVSAHLWNANNAFDFAIAWNSKKHFLVKDLDFAEVLKDAQPDDVDVFARMIMVGLQGIDDIRGWFYTRGGTL